MTAAEALKELRERLSGNDRDRVKLVNTIDKLERGFDASRKVKCAVCDIPSRMGIVIQCPECKVSRKRPETSTAG